MNWESLRIVNNTEATPTLEAIALTNCDWAYTQDLDNEEPVASHDFRQGTVEVDAGANYRIDLSVRYHSQRPSRPYAKGPYDVTISCGRAGPNNTPFVHLGLTKK